MKITKPSVRFSPTAWAKLLYLRDLTDNEVGGFGISKTDDLLLVTDFEIVKQRVSAVSVLFDDSSVADFFDTQVKKGKNPREFARIWVHTHPGDSPYPSSTDEETFSRVFGGCDWSVMVIVAQNSCTYGRLRFNIGPCGDIEVDVKVDYSQSFEAPDFNTWKKQYSKNVKVDDIFDIPRDFKTYNCNIGNIGPSLSVDEILEELDMMEPFEREFFLEELAIRSDIWNESEVF